MPYPPNLLNSLRVVKGQSKSFEITISRKNGARAKLSSDVKILFSVSRGSTVFFTKTSDTDGGIRITDRENGKAIVTLEVTDTNILDVGANQYDVWVDHGGNPPRREPVVERAQLYATESVTVFDS